MNRNDQFSESTLQLFGALANHSRADINKLASVWSRQDGDNNHFDDRHEMQQGDEDGPQHHQQQPQSAADDHHGGASSFSLQGNNEHAYQHKDSGYNYEQRLEDGSRASSRAGSRAGSRASSKASSRASRKSQRHAFVDIGEDDENDVPPGIDLTRINNNNPQQSAVLSAKGFVQSHEPGTAHNNRHTTSSAERRLHERSSRSAASSGRSHRHHRRHHHHHHSHRHRDQEQGNDRHRSHHSHYSGNELRGEGSGGNNRSGHRSSGYRSSGSRQQDAAADKHHYSASHILRVEDEEKEMVIRQIQNFEERYGFFLKRPVSRQDTLGACRAALEDLKNRKIQEENASFVFNMVVGGCGLIEWGMVSLGATKMHGWSQCLKYHDKISTNNAHNNNLKPIMIELAKRMFTQGEKSNPYLQLGVALARSAGEYFKHGPPPPEAPLQPQYQTATTAPSSSSSSNTTNSGTYVHVNHNTSQPLPTPTPGSNQAPATGPTLRPLPFARARAPPTNNPAAPSAGGGGGGLSSLVSMLPTFLSMMSA